MYFSVQLNACSSLIDNEIQNTQNKKILWENSYRERKILQKFPTWFDGEWTKFVWRKVAQNLSSFMFECTLKFFIVTDFLKAKQNF